MRNNITNSLVDVTLLSDDELVSGIKTHNDDARLKDEFWRRTYSAIDHAVAYACSKVGYGLVTNAVERPDAMGDACLAAWDAAMLYDGSKGTSLRTYIWQKVLFRFLDQKRRKAIRAGRETLLSAYEKLDDEGSFYNTDYIEAGYDKERYEDDQHDYETGFACERVQDFVSADRDRACLEALKKAFAAGEAKPIESVAAKLHCSRQQVYNILKRVKKSLPGQLAAEVVDHL